MSFLSTIVDVESVHFYCFRIYYFRISKGDQLLGIDDWYKFINVDEFTIKLLNLKSLFQTEIEKINGNLSEVTLEYMEGEPKIIKNPIPYILEWH